MASTTDLSKKYQQKTEIEHILHRPNVYIGSILVQNEEMWIKTEEKMENKTNALIWFKNDLRITDHEPLFTVEKLGLCAFPVYIIDPRDYEIHR
jgi:hypothetical protein